MKFGEIRAVGRDHRVATQPWSGIPGRLGAETLVGWCDALFVEEFGTAPNLAASNVFWLRWPSRAATSCCGQCAMRRSRWRGSTPPSHVADARSDRIYRRLGFVPVAALVQYAFSG